MWRGRIVDILSRNMNVAGRGSTRMQDSSDRSLISKPQLYLLEQVKQKNRNESDTRHTERQSHTMREIMTTDKEDLNIHRREHSWNTGGNTAGTNTDKQDRGSKTKHNEYRMRDTEIMRQKTCSWQSDWRINTQRHVWLGEAKGKKNMITKHHLT